MSNKKLIIKSEPQLTLSQSMELFKKTFTNE